MPRRSWILSATWHTALKCSKQTKCKVIVPEASLKCGDWTHRIFKRRKCNGTTVEREALERQVTLVLVAPSFCPPLSGCEIPAFSL